MVFIDHSVMLLQCEKINTLILGLHLSLFCLVVLQSPRLLDTREAYVAAFWRIFFNNKKILESVKNELQNNCLHLQMFPIDFDAMYLVRDGGRSENLGWRVVMGRASAATANFRSAKIWGRVLFNMGDICKICEKRRSTLRNSLFY